MLASEGKGVGKTEFTKKLLKSKLIVPPPKYVVWCYAENQQDLFEELLKMIVESITGELDNYFKKRKIKNVEYVEGIPGMWNMWNMWKVFLESWTTISRRTK